MEQKIILLIIFSVFLLVVFFLLNAWLPTSTFFGKVLSHGDRSSKQIALTFDDGPGSETSAIIDLLEEKKVPATFFLVGEQVKYHPDIVLREINEGFDIGIHTMTHPFLYHKNYELNLEKKQIDHILKEKNISYSIRYFRPPYGFRTWTTIKTANSLGLKTVLWDVFPRDYSSTKNQIVRRVLQKAKPGSVVCMHDGPTNRTETLAALSIIIDELRARGFEFVSLNELEKN